jgi:hypothetical protein
VTIPEVQIDFETEPLFEGTLRAGGSLKLLEVRFRQTSRYCPSVAEPIVDWPAERFAEQLEPCRSLVALAESTGGSTVNAVAARKKAAARLRIIE